VSDVLCGQFIRKGVPNNNRSDEGPEFVPAVWERGQVSGEGFSRKAVVRLHTTPSTNF
jgi:hypothetical protein